MHFGKSMKKTINGYGHANVSELGLHFGKSIKTREDPVRLSLVPQLRSSKKKIEKKNWVICGPVLLSLEVVAVFQAQKFQNLKKS